MVKKKEIGDAPLMVEKYRKVEFTIEGLSPYSPSRPIDAEKRDRQTPDSFDEEHWRERAHVNDEGHVCLAPQSLYLALLQACMLRGDKIPGRGNKTWTDVFMTGVTMETFMPVLNPLIKRDNLACDKRYVPSDGTPAFKARGTSKRVWRRFPIIPSGWRATLVAEIGNEAITEEVFLKHLVDAGRKIGLGRFRPSSRGFYGRFVVTDYKFTE